MDWLGYFTLVNATLGLGDLEVANGLAEWFVNYPTRHKNTDWFDETYGACCLAALGRDSQALDMLEQIVRSPRLVPVPLLQDSPCFQKFAGNPRYQSVVEHFNARRAELRKRLPATLAEFGVSL